MKLVWNAEGQRFYETGIDQGVLYVGGIGVAWPGIVSVEEEPSGGEPRPFYIDGIKYLNLASAEEFEATLTAFSSPLEFAPCDGTAQIHMGLFATQQPRKQFGLSYRTKIGNDTDGPDHAYKIHLVYNALAGPASREHTSIGDSAEPSTLSWEITTLPPRLTGYRPTAHFVIDSRYTPPLVLEMIEDILYGNDEAEASLPTVAFLRDIFSVTP